MIHMTAALRCLHLVDRGMQGGKRMHIGFNDTQHRIHSFLCYDGHESHLFI